MGSESRAFVFRTSNFEKEKLKGGQQANQGKTGQVGVGGWSGG